LTQQQLQFQMQLPYI